MPSNTPMAPNPIEKAIKLKARGSNIGRAASWICRRAMCGISYILEEQPHQFLQLDRTKISISKDQLPQS